MADQKLLDQKDILLLKLLETTKDLLYITEALLKNPGAGQRVMLTGKVMKLRKTLPRTASDIKTITNRKDMRTLSIRTFSGQGDDDGE